MIGVLLWAGVGAVALGAAVGIAAAHLRLGLALQAIGAALVGVGGVWAILADQPGGSAFASGLLPRVGVDRLSGVFLLAVAIVAAPTLVFARDYLGPTPAGRATAALTGGFLLAMVLVLCARDAVTFLACWELMTLAPATVILVSRADDAARRTVFVYLAITHLGSVGVWGALLYLSAIGGIGDPAALLAAGGRAQALVAVAAIIGFGTKAGMMPLHPWLPRAHPIAPAPVSALMSGVMVKVAVYGLIRVLVDWSPAPSVAVGALLLALGALSAVGGIGRALFARDLKRILAFSTIENVGVVLAAVGASLLLRRAGQDGWATVALAAALLHTLTHAAAKALLFLAAGAIDHAAGGVDLDRLGGLLRTMPRAGTAFLVGAASLAALPPLGGFVSEWLVLRSLVALVATGTVVSSISGALALVALGAAAGIAAYGFLRVVGLVLTGPPRSDHAATAVDPPRGMVGALAALAFACVALGLAPGVLVPALARAVGSLDLASGVALALPGSGSLAPVGVAVVLLAVTALLARLRGTRAAPIEQTWVCGHPTEPVLLVTSKGFVNALQLVIGTFLHPRHEPSFELHLYRPVVRLALGSAHVARRLQGGSLGVYVSYLIGLLLALLAAVRLGWLG